MSDTQMIRNDKFGFSIARVGGLCLIVVTLGGLVLWCASMPFRLEAAEKKIEALEMRSKASEDMLSRIDERTKIILERIGGQR